MLRDSRSFKDKELREAVLSTVVSALDGENCSAILRAADDMACSRLRKAALNHIISNFDAALEASTFFSDLTPALLVEVLKHVSVGGCCNQHDNDAHASSSSMCSAMRGATHWSTLLKT